jgi:PTS system nitrogen regulatory IIA component
MMLPPDFITLERIGFRLGIASKKSLLQRLGILLATVQSNLSPDLVFDRLLARERLGSTGFGRGIALPHARMASLDHAVGAFVQLQEGVDFDATDNLPVDMAFALLVS